MKKTLEDILNSCTAKELDTVLEGLEEDTPDEVTLERLTQAAMDKAGLAKQGRGRGQRPWLRWMAAAACLALVLGGGTWAWAAEVKEYNTAVEFFAEHDLSTEGLTRTEVKEVYRDIAAETFTYAKTALVLERSFAVEGLPGLNISTAAPAPRTPEELRAIWEAQNASRTYGLVYEYKLDESLGFEVFDRSILEKRDGEELVWSVVFTDFVVDDFKEKSDGGLLVWGYTPTWSSQQSSSAWLAEVDAGGKVLWQSELDHGYRHEDIAHVLENGDGTYAVFSRGDLDVVLSQYAADGGELMTRSVQVGVCGIRNVARLGEDYIVQLEDSIVKLSRYGVLTDAFTYAAQECRYFINDMVEFEGKLYLSTHSVPVLPDETQDAGGRYDVAAVLNEVFDREGWEISDQELTGLLRENYTAVLLVCDTDSGTPETFYTVGGAVGGKLSVEGERLVWDTERFVSSYFSPATSSFTIAATCEVTRNTFDAAGKLIAQEQTDRLTDFRR